MMHSIENDMDFLYHYTAKSLFLSFQLFPRQTEVAIAEIYQAKNTQIVTG